MVLVQSTKFFLMDLKDNCFCFSQESQNIAFRCKFAGEMKQTANVLVGIWVSILFIQNIFTIVHACNVKSINTTQLQSYFFFLLKEVGSHTVILISHTFDNV